MIKNLSSFRSSSDIKPEIHAVLVTPSKIVATDSFKLIEITTPTGATEDTLVNIPKALKTIEAVTYKEDKIGTMAKGAWYELETVKGTYPNYTPVIPTQKPLATIRVNAEYLKEIALAFESATKKGKHPEVNIEFHGEGKPLKFTSEDKTIMALLMPMSGNKYTTRND